MYFWLLNFIDLWYFFFRFIEPLITQENTRVSFFSLPIQLQCMKFGSLDPQPTFFLSDFIWIFVNWVVLTTKMMSLKTSLYSLFVGPYILGVGLFPAGQDTVSLFSERNFQSWTFKNCLWIELLADLKSTILHHHTHLKDFTMFPSSQAPSLDSLTSVLELPMTSSSTISTQLSLICCPQDGAQNPRILLATFHPTAIIVSCVDEGQPTCPKLLINMRNGE